MIIIDLGYEICDIRCTFCDLEGCDRFVITSCRNIVYSIRIESLVCFEELLIMNLNCKTERIIKEFSNQ
jgi:hypothetical protein